MVDFSEIAGHESAKRAIEIAVAGGLTLCIYGPTGSGVNILHKAMTDLAGMCKVIMPVGMPIDMYLEIQPVRVELALAYIKQEYSAEVASRITSYHERNPMAMQWPERWMPKLGSEIPSHCKNMIINSTIPVQPMHLLPIYKVAKTIQGLAGCDTMRVEHIAEAKSYAVLAATPNL